MATLRVAWRFQRWEIAFVAVVCLGLAAFAAWQAVDMRSILSRCGTPDATTAACDFVFAFQETHGGNVGLAQTLTGYAPIVVGLALGVPLVTREVEHRTALISWPMARARLRWLALRLVPVLVIGLGLTAILAVAADQMARAYFPHTDIGFAHYEERGVPLVMRTAFVLVAAVAIGAVIGRVLPALLVGIGLSVAVTVGLALALPYWAEPTVLQDIETDPAAMIGARLHTEVQYRLPSGEVISADEGESFAEALHEEAGGEPDPALMPQMFITGVAPDRYWEVVLRESAAIGAATILVAGLAALVVSRRRPE
jgi:hypothetical protein